MAQGIVTFELAITNLQAKDKLSKNTNKVAFKRIVAALKHSLNTNAKTITQYIESGLWLRPPIGECSVR
ncbi:MAG: hypothetical protein EAY81_03825 [Bacteroidetes bacterium]|nr:MAG: hypothetical protein EAY81_03825 [Bacteroidota bacterium]